MLPHQLDFRFALTTFSRPSGLVEPLSVTEICQLDVGGICSGNGMVTLGHMLEGH